MLENPAKSSIPLDRGANQSAEESAAGHRVKPELPDPWDAELPQPPKPAHPAWQFPLDPQHELGAAPSPDGILSPHPSAPQLSAHLEPFLESSFAPAETDPDYRQEEAQDDEAQDKAIDPATVLLTDELKISQNQAKGLWDHIRSVFALLWWRGPEVDT